MSLFFQHWRQQAFPGKEAAALSERTNRLVHDLSLRLQQAGTATDNALRAVWSGCGALGPRISGDNRIEGEVKDILEHLHFDVDNAKGFAHLAFLSHHKKDGGDAARILRDTALRIYSESLNLNEESRRWIETQAKETSDSLRQVSLRPRL